MKIDRPAPDILLNTDRTAEVKKKQDPKPVTSDTLKSRSDKLSSESMRQRMTKWFAQAGIRPPLASGFDRGIENKVERRATMQAQRKMQNLENILSLAMDFCLDQGKSEDLDPDWFFSFIGMAEDIYSPAMQELWGKIFAVEVSQAGSFSLRTLRTLTQLTQRDAQIFRLAASLVSKRRGEHSPRILFGYYQKTSVWSLFNPHKSAQLNLAQYGLSYPDLLSLMDMGLIYNSEIESGELDPQRSSDWRCGDQAFELTAKKLGTTLNYYKFTSTGAELCKLITGAPQQSYIEALKACLSGGFLIHQ